MYLAGFVADKRQIRYYLPHIVAWALIRLIYP